MRKFGGDSTAFSNEMSIALSATIYPSRQVSIAVSGMSVVVMGGVLLSLFEISGNFSFHAKMFLTVMSVFGTAIACYQFHRQQLVWRIDISNTGAIRLDPLKPQKTAEYNKVFQLMPDATLWPHVMLLKLRAEDGQRVSLRVLPDSVTAQEFRALSVALRWIAARGGLSDHDMNLEEGAPLA